MPYTAQENEAAIVLHPSCEPSAAVIWLHGLGADGYDFVPIVDELPLPPLLGVRFVFPHAEYRPVTINNGYVMRAWYDIRGFSATTPEDDVGIRRSERLICELIDSEHRGGIPRERIIVAGFSQGGAMALHTGLRYPHRLGGIIALSTYLPLRSTLSQEAAAANRDIPILMCHGERDGVVPLMLGILSRDLLTASGYAVEWKAYPMEHQVTPREVSDIGAWMGQRLGTKPGSAA